MTALPQFGAPLGDGVYAADVAGELVGVPTGLELAMNAQGRPNVLLERFRGEDPNRPPAGYGLVSVGLRLIAPVLSSDGRPVRHRALASSGVLRVELVDGDPGVELPSASLSWDGSLSALWGTRVDPDTIVWLIDMLRRGELPLRATADLEAPGLAATVAGSVTIDWTALRAAFVPDADGTVSRQALSTWLITGGLGEGRPLSVTGTATTEAVVAAVVDRLRAAGTSCPDRPERFGWPPEPSNGTQTLDLGVVCRTFRHLQVTSDLRDQLAALDPQACVPMGVEVPSIDLGWHQVDVLANLPASRSGVLAFGVDLTAAPHPPARPQAAVAGTELDGRALLTLRLAPGEERRYTSRGWIIRESADGVVETAGTPREHTDQRVLLSPDDFGVHFIPVAADPAVLALGTLTATLSVDDVAQGSVTLTPAAAEAVFAVDESLGDERCRLALTLTSPTGARLDLGDRPGGTVQIGLPDLPGWGPRTVPVSTSAATFVAVECTDEDGEQSAILALTASASAGEFRYLARDPFRAGYRYRLRPVGAPGPWHGPFPADSPLLIGATK